MTLGEFIAAGVGWFLIALVVALVFCRVARANETGTDTRVVFDQEKHA